MKHCAYMNIYTSLHSHSLSLYRTQFIVILLLRSGDERLGPVVPLHLYLGCLRGTPVEQACFTPGVQDLIALRESAPPQRGQAARGRGGGGHLADALALHF